MMWRGVPVSQMYTMYFITVAHNRWSRIGSRVCSQRCTFNRQTYVGGAETSVWQAVWEPGLPTLQPSLWVARSAIGRASRPISGRRDLRKTPPCTRAACTQKSQEKRGCWASAVTLHCAEMWSSGRSCRWGEIELTHLFNALAGFAVMELLAWAQRSSSHMSVQERRHTFLQPPSVLYSREVFHVTASLRQVAVVW